ncbi:MAG: RimK family alpha-L-glutamate ligase [Methanosarcinales archaeon]|nr:RimK family alpha-L-glutamate ligase [Methanosarcinales archaeon]
MKSIGIAVTEPQDWTARALYEAVTRAGWSPFVFRLHDVTTRMLGETELVSGDMDLRSLDAVIVRDVGGGGGDDTEGMSYRFDVLCNLDKQGIKIVNPPLAIQTAANKHMSSYLFKQQGLSTPDTILTSDLDKAVNVVREWGRAVIKPIFGFKGLDIHCVVDDESSKKLLNKHLKRRGVLYLQRYIPNPGRDIRVFVVDGRVSGAIYRNAPPGSWINNLSQGGSPRHCPISPEIEELACGATRAVGAVYAGVDLIEGEEGLSILEANGTPSGKGIFEACGIDVTVDIVRYVIKEIDE